MPTDQYVVDVASATSAARERAIRSGAADGDSHYSNVFTCIPFALPFRPPRTTPKPFVHGSQTARSSGPPARRSSPTSTAG